MTTQLTDEERRQAALDALRIITQIGTPSEKLRAAELILAYTNHIGV